jgi:hypothetical protein
MHLFEGECCSFLAAASKSNALTPHGFVRISNLMAFDWFHPDSGLGLSGVSDRRGRRESSSMLRLPDNPRGVVTVPRPERRGPETRES